MRLRRDKKNSRQSEAAGRQREHDALTPAAKIAKLDAKLGVGQGAKRERKRLAVAK